MPAGHEVFIIFTAPEIGWTDATFAIEPSVLGHEFQGAAAVGLTLFLFGGKPSNKVAVNASLLNSSSTKSSLKSLSIESSLTKSSYRYCNSDG